MADFNLLCDKSTTRIKFNNEVWVKTGHNLYEIFIERDGIKGKLVAMSDGTHINLSMQQNAFCGSYPTYLLHHTHFEPL